LISHQALTDTDTLGPFKIDALIRHRTGITSATLYHTSDTASGFTSVTMTLTAPANNTWTGYIPAYPAGTTIFYYIGAAATSGKTQVRPITAPSGWWKFNISLTAGLPKAPQAIDLNLGDPYPNPARAITCIPVESNTSLHATVGLYDINGRLVNSLFSGELKPGTNNMFFNATNFSAGVYYIRLETEEGIQTKKVIVYGY